MNISKTFFKTCIMFVQCIFIYIGKPYIHFKAKSSSGYFETQP